MPTNTLRPQRREGTTKNRHQVAAKDALDQPQTRRGQDTAEIEVADAPNRVWAVDFQFDSTADGCSVKIAASLQPPTRCCPGRRIRATPAHGGTALADYAHGTDNVAGKSVNGVGSQSAKWPAVRRGMAVVVAVDVAVAAYAPIATDVFRWYYWLQVGAAVIAVTTFLGV